jgi:hypothetical protein
MTAVLVESPRRIHSDVQDDAPSDVVPEATIVITAGKCPKCSGSGRVRCTQAGGCSNCNFTGWHACLSCGGTGQK